MKAVTSAISAALTEVLKPVGGIDGLTNAIAGITANQAAERDSIVAEIITNGSTIGKDVLESMPIEALNAIRADMQPKYYAGANVFQANVESKKIVPLGVPSLIEKEDK